MPIEWTIASGRETSDPSKSWNLSGSCSDKSPAKMLAALLQTGNFVPIVLADANVKRKKIQYPTSDEVEKVAYNRKGDRATVANMPNSQHKTNGANLMNSKVVCRLRAKA